MIIGDINMCLCRRLPQAMPIVVFFSSVMSVLYFLGLMQWLILKVNIYLLSHRPGRATCWITYAGLLTTCCFFCVFVFLPTQISWIMQITMGTSPTETLSVAGNIFIGQVIYEHVLWFYNIVFLFPFSFNSYSPRLFFPFFVHQTEAPLLIRPYLKDMTKSEIHAVMTGGFATIAGSVMGAFISFGVTRHIIFKNANNVCLILSCKKSL